MALEIKPPVVFSFSRQLLASVMGSLKITTYLLVKHCSLTLEQYRAFENREEENFLERQWVKCCAALPYITKRFYSRKGDRRIHNQPTIPLFFLGWYFLEIMVKYLQHTVTVLLGMTQLVISMTVYLLFQIRSSMYSHSSIDISESRSKLKTY